MSLTTPSDGRERSGSGETQARPGATVKMIDKHALVHYLNEKRAVFCSPGQHSQSAHPHTVLALLARLPQ